MMVRSISVDDFDASTAGVGPLALSWSQLGEGNFDAEIKAVDLDGIWISKQSANLSLGFRGYVRAGIADLRLWTHREGRISAAGRVAKPGQALLAMPGDLLDVTVLGSSRSIGFTFDLGMLPGAETVESLRRLYHDPAERGFINVAPVLVTELLRLARAAFETANSSEPFAVLPAAFVGLRADLLASIAFLLNETARRPTSGESQTASSTVQAAMDYMMTHLTEALTLQDLCRACGWSKRSLIYHFSETLGITPMAYFKLQRLNAVRRALKRADPRACRVLDIAANYGFYHMGHFAVDYRALFGTLPSQTLRLRNGEAARGEGTARLSIA